MKSLPPIGSLRPVNAPSTYWRTTICPAAPYKRDPPLGSTPKSGPPTPAVLWPSPPGAQQKWHPKSAENATSKQHPTNIQKVGMESIHHPYIHLTSIYPKIHLTSGRTGWSVEPSFQLTPVQTPTATPTAANTLSSAFPDAFNRCCFFRWAMIILRCGIWESNDVLDIFINYFGEVSNLFKSWHVKLVPSQVIRTSPQPGQPSRHCAVPVLCLQPMRSWTTQAMKRHWAWFQSQHVSTL